MRVTAKTDYAVRAMLELAAVTGDQPVKAETLASAQGIPAPFLQNILQTLRNAGLVESRRGQVGGHRLAKPADEITIADVIRAVDGPLGQVAGIAPEEVDHPGAARHMREAYVALRAGVRGVLEQMTLADVVAGRFTDEVRALLEVPDAWKRR